MTRATNGIIFISFCIYLSKNPVMIKSLRDKNYFALNELFISFLSLFLNQGLYQDTSVVVVCTRCEFHS